MARELPMRVLTRMWQMLLKAMEEVASAPNAMMAAEMAIIRLTHVADLPSPEELLRRLQDAPPTGPGSGGTRLAQSASTPAASGGASAVASARPSGNGSVQTAPNAMLDSALARFPTFEYVTELIRANRDVKLLVEVETGLKLVSYQPGRIEFEPADNAPSDLAQRLGARLQSWTGNRWAISVVSEGGATTIADLRDAEENALKAQAQEHPLVQAVLARFPKARITDIRTPDQIAADAETEALPEVDDEWDPFEED